MLSFRVLLAITALSCVYSAICLFRGKEFCNRKGDCNGNELCFADLDNETSNVCCVENGTFCTATGWKSSYMNGTLYYHKYQKDLHNNGDYYMDNRTGAACRFPFAVSPLDGKHLLPKGFSKNGTEKLELCSNHKMCGKGYFCAQTDDGNSEGTSKKYCYKTPVLYENMRVSMSLKGNVDVCNSTDQCKNGFCVGHKINNSDGVCIEGNICKNGASVATHNNMAIVCENMKKCQVGNYADKHFPMKCMQYNPKTKISKGICCVTIEKCTGGISTVPQMQCNSTLDCNSRSNYTPIKEQWGSWCDKKGFCCHDPKHVTTTMCPDQTTPVCNEDTCTTESDDEEYWHIIVISVTILIVLTFIGLLIYKCKKPIRNYLRRKAAEREKRRIKMIVERAEEKKQVLRMFCNQLVGNCVFTRYEVGMPKTLPHDMIDELIHIGYEDFADKYDYSYQQSKIEWEKWSGDLMDNVLAQEIVAEKEKTAGTVFIPREVEISKEDLERGKKEQPEISLKDVYFKEKDYCVYKIGSDIDDVELEPSTESDLSSSDDDSEPKTKQESKADKKKKKENTPKAAEGSTKSKAKSTSAKKDKPSNGQTTSLKSTKSKQQKADHKEAVKDAKSLTTPNETAQKSGNTNKSKSKGQKGKNKGK